MKQAMKLAVALVAVLVVLAGAPAARADSFYGNYPDPVDTANPASAQLVSARAALDASISAFWAVYSSSPYDYWAVVEAYYAYGNAYYAYRWALDAYWQQEQPALAFRGTVRTRDVDPGQAIPQIYPWPGFAVSGAQVLLSTYVPPGLGMPTAIVGTQTTGDDGSFAFTGLAARKYNYSVSKDGFGTASGTIDLSGGTVTQTVYLSKRRVLSGIVVTPQLFGAQPIDFPPARFAPRPVPGATVTMTYSPLSGVQNWMSILRTATTDASGRFSFDGIPTDVRVNVSVDASGYQPASQSYVLDRQQTDVTLTIYSTAPPPRIALPAGGGQAVPTSTSGNDVNNPFAR